MHNPKLRNAINDSHSYLQKIWPVENPPSNNYDLVLDMHEEGGRMQWFYYYACHETRCLFWLETYDAKDMILEVFWVASPTHVSASPILLSKFCLSQPNHFSEHRLEALYWCFCYAELDLGCIDRYCLSRSHWSLYPNVFERRRLEPAIYDELVGILSHGCIGKFGYLSHFHNEVHPLMR